MAVAEKDKEEAEDDEGNAPEKEADRIDFPERLREVPRGTLRGRSL